MDAYVQMHEDDKIVESKDVLTEDFYIRDFIWNIQKAELNDMIKM